ncbi:MAG: tetratricopeptide repeat-containing sensor histidine kinase [Candidatus Kapabacteria bacterium]|nr:tetratricopeptide repeat-containing sensor histidine kinase [Candidatus Kapabacteria bacterium]
MRREWGTIVDTGIVNLLNSVAAEYRTSQPFKALEYCEQALKHARNLGYKAGIAEAASTMGNIHTQQGTYERAIQNYLEALNIFEELRQKERIAATLSLLGIAYSKRGNNRQSLEMYEKARTIYAELGDKRGLAKTLGNMASLYSDNGDDRIALTFYEKTLALHREFGDSVSVAAALNGIGIAHINLGNYDKALQCLQETERIFTSQPNTDPSILGDIYNNFAVIYIYKQQYAQALEYVRKALALAEASGLRSLRQNCYAILSDIYKSLGNYKLALEYAERDNILKDSIFSEESDKLLASAMRSYEIQRKEDSIRTLMQDKQIRDQQLQLQAQQLQLQRQQLLFLAIGFVLVIVIVGLLANGYRIRRRSERELQHKNTELALANQEIAQKNQYLEELNNEKNEFLGIVAHDLKSPILSIKLLAQLLRDQNISHEEHQRYANTIISSSEQLSRIISNLLNVNAIERGAVTLNITAFNLSVAAYSVYEEYAPRAEAKHVQLHFESFSDSECLGDQTAVIQVMDNLISNALKYSPSYKNVWFRVYGERLWTHHRNGTHNYPTPKCMRIEVQDEGPGISEDDMKKLFGKFQRLSAKPTSGEQSTGLGLSIVKKMVTAMHGEVWCESTLGHGAVFIVELPQAE